jgi:hypothetical protein
MDANRQPHGDSWIRCSDSEIVAAWIDFESRPHALQEDWIRDRAWWALEIAFQIARTSERPKVLEMLGAGPLEDLLSEDPTLIDAVAIEAQSSPNLRIALRATWQSAMPDDVWRAVQNLAAG